jgi:predicted DNA-binding WGR domain protein
MKTFDIASWITLRRVRGTRYYRVHLEQDLWRGWRLTQVNGRIDSRLGRARSRKAPSIDVALFELSKIAARRRKRGYELLS